MAKSYTQIVTDLQSARDNIIDAFIENRGVKTLIVRNKEVTINNYKQVLVEIEDLISMYQDLDSGTTRHTHTRSRAELKR